jgi:hypothetical protein
MVLSQILAQIQSIIMRGLELLQVSKIFRSNNVRLLVFLSVFAIIL